MSLATSSSLGEITLAGDLTGTASAPALSATGVSSGTYSVPTLTIDSKGRITSASTGTLNTILASIPSASSSVAGLVKIGSNISVDANGTISIPTATSSTAGAIKAGSGLSIIGGVLSAVKATASTLGVVTPGAGISVSSGVISISAATSTSLGGVKIGSNINVDANGTISIPTASTTVAGVAKFGAGLTISSGTVSVNIASTSTPGLAQVGSGLSVSSGVISVPVATASSAGIVKPGTGLTVDGSGVISLNTASSTTFGGFKVGTGLTVSSGVVSIDTSNLGLSNYATKDGAIPFAGAVIENANTSAAYLSSSGGTTLIDVASAKVFVITIAASVTAVTPVVVNFLTSNLSSLVAANGYSISNTSTELCVIFKSENLTTFSMSSLSFQLNGIALATGYVPTTASGSPIYIYRFQHVGSSGLYPI